MKLKKIFLTLILAATALSFTGCNSSPSASWLFTYTKQHLSGKSAGQQLSSAPLGSKVGKDCSFGSYFFAFFFYGGGASIQEAAQSAGITRIAVADRESLNILWTVFYRECVIVYGD